MAKLPQVPTEETLGQSQDRFMSPDLSGEWGYKWL